MLQTLHPVPLSGSREAYAGGDPAHVIPSTGTVTVMLTQREMADPTPTATMREFWRHAATPD